MSAIDKAVAGAFCGGYAMSASNTVVTDGGGHVRVHGNTIARKAVRGQRCIIIDHCGWITSVTMNRLNAILDQYAPYCKIRKVKGQFVIDTPYGTVPFVRNMVVYKDVDWTTGKVFPVEMDTRRA